MRRRQPTAGFTLVEVLMVVLLMSVLAAIALPSMNPSIHDQLQAVAEIVANDMAYGRSLAVANNGTYRFTFDLTNNQYYLQYTGELGFGHATEQRQLHRPGFGHPALYDSQQPANARRQRPIGRGRHDRQLRHPGHPG